LVVVTTLAHLPRLKDVYRLVFVGNAVEYVPAQAQAVHNHTQAVAVVEFRIVILFCHNAVCNGKSNQLGHLNFNTDFQDIDLVYILDVQEDGVAGSEDILVRLIPSSNCTTMFV
jgi:cyanophycinase-like exopeptidase